MEWFWSGWLLLAFVVYGFGALFVYAIIYRGAERPLNKVENLILLSFAGFLWCIGAAGFNVFTMAVSSGTSGPTSISTHQAAHTLGLESGKPYPVQIGSRVDGSVGEGYFYGGIFSSGGAVSIQPGSSVSMSFSNDSQSYILNIPMNKVVFEQSNDAESSVQLYLLDSRRGGFGSYGVDCRLVIQSLMFINRCDVTDDLNDFEATQRRGLAPIVTEYLDSATITLSPELYQELLGTP